MNPAEWLCYRLALHMLRRRKPGDAGANPASYRREDYEEHRARTLEQEFDKYFSTVDLHGLDVLDFGCGHGGLAAYVARRGVRSVTGMDLAADRIASAETRVRSMDLPVKPRFIVAADERTIPLESGSVDAILCFDVLEHVMAYEAIVREWRRVLRPNGRVLIHWVPWWNPYGPHINSLVPIPWSHVLFSERVLINTCARIYDLPDFVPKHWDLDEQGRKKPNKWRVLKELPEVNRLTIRQFERTARAIGFELIRRQIVGFGGRAGRWTRGLTSVPWINELFTSHTVYKLLKPETARRQHARSRARERAKSPA